MTFALRLERAPLVAILRGVRPTEIIDVVDALVETGFELIEIPLNSPSPFASIRAAARHVGSRALIGAGTVMTARDVQDVLNNDGQFIVMPHGDADVIEVAKDRELACLPGVATPTEAFAALARGADALKLFPAENLPPAVLKAWRAVLPDGVALLPVGGIAPPTMHAYLEAGARGFGLGSALYRAGDSAETVHRNAKSFMAALDACRAAK